MREIHKVSLDDLIEYVSETAVTFAKSVGNGSHKELKVTLNGFYIIIDHKEEKMVTKSPEEAIEYYNSFR